MKNPIDFRPDQEPLIISSPPGEHHPCLCYICLNARDAELKRSQDATIQKVLEIINRKKKFYEGAHGGHWEGFISCLDTLSEEIGAIEREFKEN